MNDAFVTWSVIGMSLAALLALSLCKINRLTNFIASLLLIGLSIAMAWALSKLIFVIDHSKSASAAQAIIFDNAKFAANFWLLVFPAVFGAIGVNMLSNFLQPPR